MAKKKSGGGSSKSGHNWQAIFLVVALVVIFILVAQLQEKDRKLANLKKGAENSMAVEKPGDGNADPGYVIKPNQEFSKEKVKKTAEQNLEKLLGKSKKPGENWFVDDIKFIKNDIIKISYEDGHTVNSVTFKITDPDDYRTWIKQ